MIYSLPLIITLAITPVIRVFAFRKGFTDNADGDPLKIHKNPTPLLGGLAIVIATIVGLILAGNGAGGFEINQKNLLGIMLGGLLVSGVGLWDDIKGVKPQIRISVHLIAGIIILLSGLKVNILPIPWIVIPLTVFYIIGAINAYNVVDGMDGLCSGLSIISSLGFFFYGLIGANIILMMLSSIVFMSLLGFFPYNFQPARIFLGDTGSGYLGFMMGTMAVVGTSEPYNIKTFIIPILIMAIPLLDMALAIIRRLVKRKSLFAGDRDHIYDLLLRKGWSQTKTWSLICGAQFILVLVAIAI